MKLLEGYDKKGLKIMWDLFYKDKYPNRKPKIKDFGVGYALFI